MFTMALDDDIGDIPRSPSDQIMGVLSIVYIIIFCISCSILRMFSTTDWTADTIFSHTSIFYLHPRLYSVLPGKSDPMIQYIPDWFHTIDDKYL